ncbi:SRPBCC family protein [uncultured Jatrophihabitans sp.]|uniref:SRPBCC family protein n=1 Tax=uncultured Jatrophihabitans sp. TaxID=1610747 RepID=UPI0035CAB6D8
MITVEREVVVERPLPNVFAYLTDFTNTEQWDPGTISTVRTDGDGPLVVGAAFRNVSEYRGRRTELDYRIARLDPDEHLTFTGVNKTVESTDDMSFRAEHSEDGERTVLTYRAHFRFKGLARLAEPFLRKGFEPIADDTVIQLKRTLEAVV